MTNERGGHGPDVRVHDCSARDDAVQHDVVGHFDVDHLARVGDLPLLDLRRDAARQLGEFSDAHAHGIDRVHPADGERRHTARQLGFP